MSAAAALICLVTGEAAGGLPTDTVVLLCDALTRAGELAALAAGGPVAKGAAPAAAGRCVALARYDAVTGVAECLYSPSFASPPGTGGGATAAAAGGGGGQQQPLFSPTPLPLDLRRWAAAARAAATPPAVAPGARAPPVRPPPAPGSCCALDALDALLLVAAPCKWTRPGAAPAGSVQLTLLCTLPQRHVAEELLAPLLGAANQQLCSVTFACFPPPGAESEPPPGAEAALRARHAARALSCALADSDNGAFEAPLATAAAAEALALRLLFGATAGGAPPSLPASLLLPGPLAVAGGGRALRLRLRPAVLPLHDAVERVKVCRCHGRGVLSADSTIGAEDVAHFLALAGKNNVCSHSAKELKEPDWLPNCVAAGRDVVLSLPSFYTFPFLADGGGGGGGGGAVQLKAVCALSLAGVSDAHTFGLPWEAWPQDEEEDDFGGGAGEEAGGDADDEDRGGGGGGGGAEPDEPGGGGAAPRASPSALRLAALCGALARADKGLLLSCGRNLDAAKATPFAAYYLAQAACTAPPPPRPTAGGGGGGDDDGGGGDAAAAAPAPAAPALLLLRRIAGREELLPPPRGGPPRVAVPPRSAAAADAALERWPSQAAYAPRDYERGTHRVLSQLLAKSLQLPTPRVGPPPGSKRRG